MRPNQSVEQAIRKSHCAQKDTIHECAGTCKITPEGIELDCPLCGKDRQPIVVPMKYSIERIIKVFGAAGIDFDRLSAETQFAVMKEFNADNCKGCQTRHVILESAVRCACGWNWSSYAGWQAPRK